MRVKRFDECEQKIAELLNFDDSCVIGIYMFAHLLIQCDELEIALLALKIAMKLAPESKEIAILLTMLFEKLEDPKGVECSEIKVKESRVLFDELDKFKSSIHLELETDDDLVKILQRQLKLELFEFAEMTKSYMATRSIDFLNPDNEIHLKIIELSSVNACDAMEFVKSLEINNEILQRIVKGNFLYESGDKWRGICEYEIAFNLSIKKEILFPWSLAARCGDWHLNHIKNLSKARRYFHYCIKISPTFNAWTSLGSISFQEMNFVEAEKCFNEANKIYNKSGDNWLYLALVNFRLNKNSKFEECLKISQKFLIQDRNLQDEAENILDL